MAAREFIVPNNALPSSGLFDTYEKFRRWVFSEIYKIGKTGGILADNHKPVVKRSSLLRVYQEIGKYADKNTWIMSAEQNRLRGPQSGPTGQGLGIARVPPRWVLKVAQDVQQISKLVEKGDLKDKAKTRSVAHDRADPRVLEPRLGYLTRSANVSMAGMTFEVRYKETYDPSNREHITVPQAVLAQYKSWKRKNLKTTKDFLEHLRKQVVLGDEQARLTLGFLMRAGRPGTVLFNYGPRELGTALLLAARGYRNRPESERVHRFSSDGNMANLGKVQLRVAKSKYYMQPLHQVPVPELMYLSKEKWLFDHYPVLAKSIVGYLKLLGNESHLPKVSQREEEDLDRLYGSTREEYDESHGKGLGAYNTKLNAPSRDLITDEKEFEKRRSQSMRELRRERKRGQDAGGYLNFIYYPQGQGWTIRPSPAEIAKYEAGIQKAGYHFTELVNTPQGWGLRITSGISSAMDDPYDFRYGEWAERQSQRPDKSGYGSKRRDDREVREHKLSQEEKRVLFSQGQPRSEMLGDPRMHKLHKTLQEAAAGEEEIRKKIWELQDVSKILDQLDNFTTAKAIRFAEKIRGSRNKEQLINVQQELYDFLNMGKFVMQPDVYNAEVLKYGPQQGLPRISEGHKKFIPYNQNTIEKAFQQHPRGEELRSVLNQLVNMEMEQETLISSAGGELDVTQGMPQEDAAEEHATETEQFTYGDKRPANVKEGSNALKRTQRGLSPAGEELMNRIDKALEDSIPPADIPDDADMEYQAIEQEVRTLAKSTQFDADHQVFPSYTMPGAKPLYMEFDTYGIPYASRRHGASSQQDGMEGSVEGMSSTGGQAAGGRGEDITATAYDIRRYREGGLR